MKKPMLTEFEGVINGYDIDFAGIVSNIVYVRWFEDIRMNMLRKYFPLTTMLKTGKAPIVVKTEIAYKTPLTIYDTPILRGWVPEMGRTKWEIEFEIATGKGMHCTGKQMGCYFDLEKNRVASIPKELLEVFYSEQ